MHWTLLVEILGNLVAPWLALLALLWLLRPRGAPARALIRLVPDLLRMLRSLIGERRVPADVRLVLVGLLAWIVSPIDLIPEFIPLLGPLDDVVVAVIALRDVRRRLGLAYLEQRWPGTAEGFAVLARVLGS
jgi:uncharacterized membrane protein YkvA (DUF1232 family)